MRKLQTARRLVQCTVLALVLAIPVVSRYNHYLLTGKLDMYMDNWQGTLEGRVLRVVDATVRLLPGTEVQQAGARIRNKKRVLEYTGRVWGGPWSAQIGGLSMTDPLAGAESILASRKLPPALLISLVAPLAVALVLGRVFCSWICPMNLLLEYSDKLRRALVLLGFKPGDAQFSRSAKYILLVVGLAITGCFAVSALGYLYPPAIVGREAHDLVTGVFDRAETARLGSWVGGLTWMSLVLLGIIALELSVSRRWWCRYLCPGGALYSLLGWGRLVRVRRRSALCDQCGTCIQACPMGLVPMRDGMGLECDNCGLCISNCESSALDYSLLRRASPGGPAT